MWHQMSSVKFIQLHRPCTLSLACAPCVKKWYWLWSICTVNLEILILLWSRSRLTGKPSCGTDFLESCLGAIMNTDEDEIWDAAAPLSYNIIPAFWLVWILTKDHAPGEVESINVGNFSAVLINAAILARLAAVFVNKLLLGNGIYRSRGPIPSLDNTRFICNVR